MKFQHVILIFIFLFSSIWAGCNQSSSSKGKPATEEAFTAFSQETKSTWEISINDTTNIRTTCENASCESISSTDKKFSVIAQRVTCKEDKLQNKSYTMRFLSSEIKVCPGLIASRVLNDLSSEKSLISTSRIELNDPNIAPEDVRFDVDSAQHVSFTHNDEGTYCEATGTFESSDVFELKGNVIQLLGPADSVLCNIPRTES